MKSFPKDNPMFEPFLDKAQREALDKVSVDIPVIIKGRMPDLSKLEYDFEGHQEPLDINTEALDKARDKLIKAGMAMWLDGKFDGEELHGKKKQL